MPVGKIYVPKRCCTEGISSFLAVRQRPTSVPFHITILFQHGKLLQQISKTESVNVRFFSKHKSSTPSSLPLVISKSPGPVCIQEERHLHKAMNTKRQESLRLLQKTITTVLLMFFREFKLMSVYSLTH